MIFLLFVIAQKIIDIFFQAKKIWIIYSAFFFD